MLCSKRTLKVTLICSISAALLIEFYAGFLTTSLKKFSSTAAKSDGSRRFAVFGCSTPEKNSHRGFDYAFYLPLTVMAWQRIGFESVVLIIGEKEEWKNNSVLNYVLDTLESLSNITTVIFIPAKVENRMMLSQTSRIFLANMKDFPGQLSDFIITTDSDLWPLRKEHFYFPPGNVTRTLMLIHSQCCGSFNLKGKSYRMLPMSHIGASAAVWKEIINVNSSSIKAANDSETILDYFQNVFGDKVRQSVVYASKDWFLDQKLISIRVHDWIDRHETSSSQHNESIVYKASDAGLHRIDRKKWNADKIMPSAFNSYFDSHLHMDGFMPNKWKSIQPLLHLMYDNTSSTRYAFCDLYRTGFHEQFTKWNNNISHLG